MGLSKIENTYASGIYTKKIADPLRKEAAQQTNKKSCVIQVFGARFTYLVHLTVGIITRVIDTALAVIYAVGSLLSLGMKHSAFELAEHHFTDLTSLIPHIVFNTVKLINPHAEFELVCECLTVTALKTLYEMGETYRSKNNFLYRHCLSRMVYALTIPIAAVTRVIDFAIGIFCTVLSFLTLGFAKKLNTLACGFTPVTGIAADVFIGVSHIINPWASVKGNNANI